MTAIAKKIDFKAVPNEIWGEITSYLTEKEVGKLLWVQGFNTPAVQRAIWQPFLNRLHALDTLNNIPYQLKEGCNAQQMFRDGLEIIKKRQMAEALSLGYNRPRLTSLADCELFHARLEAENQNLIEAQIARVQVNNLLDNATRNITRIPVYFKQDPRLLLFIHARDNNGNTPLHYARNFLYFQDLLQAGADLEVMNQEGETPFERVLESRQIDLLEYLSLEKIKNHPDTKRVLAQYGNYLVKQAYAAGDQTLLNILMDIPEIVHNLYFKRRIIANIWQYLFSDAQERIRESNPVPLKNKTWLDRLVSWRTVGYRAGYDVTAELVAGAPSAVLRLFSHWAKRPQGADRALGWIPYLLYQLMFPIVMMLDKTVVRLLANAGGCIGAIVGLMIGMVLALPKIAPPDYPVVTEDNAFFGKRGRGLLGKYIARFYRIALLLAPILWGGIAAIRVLGRIGIAAWQAGMLKKILLQILNMVIIFVAGVFVLGYVANIALLIFVGIYYCACVVYFCIKAALFILDCLGLLKPIVFVMQVLCHIILVSLELLGFFYIAQQLWDGLIRSVEIALAVGVHIAQQAWEGLKQVVYFIANAFIHACIVIDQLVDRFLKGAAYLIQAAVVGAWAWVKEKIFDRVVPVISDLAPNVVPDIIGLTVSSDDKDISDIELEVVAPVLTPGFLNAKQANRVVDHPANDDMEPVMDNITMAVNK